MISGLCCNPNCAEIHKVEEGLKKHGGDYAPSGVFVEMVCSNTDCSIGQMHRECFAKLEDQFEKEITVTYYRNGNCSGNWVRNCMWKTGTGGKYIAIKGQCACVCGAGSWVPKEDPRGGVVYRGGGGSAASDGETHASVADSKRAAAEARLAREAERKKAEELRAREERVGVSDGGGVGVSQ